MEVSLIICTRNRGDRLGHCLESLRGLSASFPWELVVVDNGSTDETSAVLQAFADTFPHPVSVVFEADLGASKARNSGWRNSSGTVLAFIDDDCYPAEDFLTAVHQCFAENPRLGFVGGRVLLHDPTDFPITIQTSEVRRLFAPEAFIPAGTIHGANLSFRRDAMAAIGGFDPRLGAGTRFLCEDVDAMARVSEALWFGAYDPRPVVRHHHGRKGFDNAVVLRRAYNRGRGAYYAKCIRNSALRRKYLEGWFAKIRWQPGVRTLQEIAGAVDFLFSSLTARARRSDRSRLTAGAVAAFRIVERGPAPALPRQARNEKPMQRITPEPVFLQRDNGDRITGRLVQEGVPHDEPADDVLYRQQRAIES